MIALNSVQELRFEVFKCLLERFGSAEKALAASEIDLLHTEGVTPAAAKKIMAGQLVKNLAA